MAKIKWYNKGKFEEEETTTEPILEIRKYRYSDSASYQGYRFWVIRKDGKILNDIKDQIFGYHSSNKDEHLNATDREAVLADKVWLANNKSDGTNGFRKWKYSELVEAFEEETIELW